MNLLDQIENVIQALTHILHHLFVIVSEWHGSMTLMGRVFEMLLSRDFVEFLGRLMPLLLVDNPWFFLAPSTWLNLETKQDHVTGIPKCNDPETQNLPNDNSHPKIQKHLSGRPTKKKIMGAQQVQWARL